MKAPDAKRRRVVQTNLQAFEHCIVQYRDLADNMGHAQKENI